MVRSLEWRLSERSVKLHDSVIRRITKLKAARPELVSFAAGVPSAETFPVERMAAAFAHVLASQGRVALQYGPSNGYAPLREWIAHSLSRPGAQIRPEQVLITSGSQQGIDLVGRVLLDEGDTVCVETPTYLGAMQVLGLYQPSFLSLPSDAGGLVADAAADVVAGLPGRRPSLLYIVPTFQNPTGSTLSLARRETLVRRFGDMGIPIVEDDPYAALDYQGRTLPSLLSLNPEGVIHLGTFSKVLTPGLRLGYVVAPMALVPKLEQAKQAADLHTAILSQMAVHEVIKDGFLDELLPRTRALYQRQNALMLDAMARHFPASARWEQPEGGMFVWVTLPEGVDSEALLETAMARGVAFVPGTPFYACDPAVNTIRLSCVALGAQEIERGIALLGALIAEAAPQR